MIKKKNIPTFIFCLLAISSLGALIVSADSQSGSSLGHDGDIWEYGPKIGLISQAQYSNFYCPKEHHQSSVKIGNSKTYGVDYYVDSADAKKWSQVTSKYYSNVDTWRSYYDHR